MPSFLLVVASVLLPVYLLYTRYSHGLNRFNGPFLASISQVWGLWHAHTVVEGPIYMDLHRKYGEIVRIGPKELLFAEPQAIQEIYGAKGAAQKVRSLS